MSLGKRLINLARSHATSLQAAQFHAVPLQGGWEHQQAEPPAPNYRGDKDGADARRRAWYATLGLPMSADLSTVRRRYRQELVRFHPDRFAKDPDKARVATEITRRLTEAYAGIATTT